MYLILKNSQFFDHLWIFGLMLMSPPRKERNSMINMKVYLIKKDYKLFTQSSKNVTDSYNVFFFITNYI